MRTFWDFLEHAEQPRAGIYPSLYTQYGHYPPCDIATWSADAMVYMDDEDLKFRFLYEPYFTPHIRKTIGNFGKGKV